ncbi:hypothetical protein FOZ62_018177, partial [Perkinsus olseni]
EKKSLSKVRKPTLTRRKNSAPPSRKVQELRVAKREKKADEITSLLESLECNSPLDELPLELKRRLACHFVLKLIHVAGRARADAEEEVAGLLDLTARAESRRGKHSKVLSPMTEPSYLCFREKLREEVKSKAIGGSGKQRLT